MLHWLGSKASKAGLCGSQREAGKGSIYSAGDDVPKVSQTQQGTADQCVRGMMATARTT